MPTDALTGRSIAAVFATDAGRSMGGGRGCATAATTATTKLSTAHGGFPSEVRSCGAYTSCAMHVDMHPDAYSSLLLRSNCRYSTLTSRAHHLWPLSTL